MARVFASFVSIHVANKGITHIRSRKEETSDVLAPYPLPHQQPLREYYNGNQQETVIHQLNRLKAHGRGHVNKKRVTVRIIGLIGKIEVTSPCATETR